MYNPLLNVKKISDIIKISSSIIIFFQVPTYSWKFITDYWRGFKIILFCPYQYPILSSRVQIGVLLWIETLQNNGILKIVPLWDLSQR